MTPSPGPSFITRTLPLLDAAVLALLVPAGFTFAIIAAFTYSTLAGLIACAVSCFAYQHFRSAPTPAETQTVEEPPAPTEVL